MRVTTQRLTTMRVATTRFVAMTKFVVAMLEQGLQLFFWEGTWATLFLYTIVSTKDDNLLKLHKDKY